MICVLRRVITQWLSVLNTAEVLLAAYEGVCPLSCVVSKRVQKTYNGQSAMRITALCARIVRSHISSQSYAIRHCCGIQIWMSKVILGPFFFSENQCINLLKPTGYVMHQQFNIQQLYVLPTLYLCVLYLSENKQRLVPLTA